MELGAMSMWMCTRCANRHVYVYVYAYIRVFAFAFVFVCMCMSVCVCVCVPLYIFSYVLHEKLRRIQYRKCSYKCQLIHANASLVLSMFLRLPHKHSKKHPIHGEQTADTHFYANAIFIQIFLFSTSQWIRNFFLNHHVIDKLELNSNDYLSFFFIVLLSMPNKHNFPFSSPFFFLPLYMLLSHEPHVQWGFACACAWVTRKGKWLEFIFIFTHKNSSSLNATYGITMIWAPRPNITIRKFQTNFGEIYHSFLRWPKCGSIYWEEKRIVQSSRCHKAIFETSNFEWQLITSFKRNVIFVAIFCSTNFPKHLKNTFYVVVHRSAVFFALALCLSLACSLTRSLAPQILSYLSKSVHEHELYKHTNWSMVANEEKNRWKNLFQWVWQYTNRLANKQWPFFWLFILRNHFSHQTNEQTKIWYFHH